MPGNQKPRRRKHRGTQTGSIATRQRSRPRNRQEAMAQARSRKSGKASGSRRAPVERGAQPPSWRGSITRGLLAAALLFPMALLLLDQTVAGALALTLVSSIIYIPLGYYTERFFWKRRMAKQAREQTARQAENGRKGS